MDSTFNKLNHIVADKKLNVYIVVEEASTRDPIPGEKLPSGYSKVPTQFKLRPVAYDANGNVVSRPYYSCTYEYAKNLYYVDDAYRDVYISSLVNVLLFLRDGVKVNAGLPTNKPVVGSHIFDTQNNFCKVTSIPVHGNTNTVVRRVDYQKILNKNGLPFRRKISEDRNKYYYPYWMVTKSHLDVAIQDSTHKICRLGSCVQHNENLTLQQRAIKKQCDEGKGLPSGRAAADMEMVDPNFIGAMAKALKETKDLKMIEEFKKVAANSQY